MKPFLATALLALTVAFACTGDQRSPDSANAGGIVSTNRISGDDAPLMTIPSSTGGNSESLTYVKGAARLSNGTIVIADGYSGHEQSIKGFGDGGQLLWSSGSKGGGPGEFQALAWFAQCAPDSMFTWDGAQSRLSVFDAQGRLAREGRLPGTPLSVNMTCSRSGNFAVMGTPAPSSPLAEQFPRLNSTLTIVNNRGDSLWSLKDVYLGQNRPLGTITRLALSQDRLYVGTGDSAYVDEYDLNGKRVAAFRVTEDPGSPTRLQYEQAIDQLLNQLPGTSEARTMAREQLLKVPLPDRLPPYSNLLADPSGRLWVVTSLAGADTTRIRAFNPGGARLGSIVIPMKVRIFEIGSDYVLGALEVPSGREVVALYRYRLNR